MRPIKFRAWDEANKRFLYPDPAQPRTGHVLDSNTNKPAYEHGRFHTQLIGVQMTLAGEVFQSCYYNAADYAGYPLQQYTGVKDKNGREIYEGDILTFADQPEKPCYYIVEWDAKYKCAGFTLTPLMKNNKEVRYPMDWHVTSWSHTLEVIGNVNMSEDLVDWKRALENRRNNFKQLFVDKNGSQIHHDDIIKLSQGWRDVCRACLKEYGHVWRHESGEWMCSYNHTFSESSDPLASIPVDCVTRLGPMREYEHLFDDSRARI